MSLKTKNVFLTGGAQGLGKGYIGGLLKLGARVVFADVDEETGRKTEAELNAEYGPGKVHFIPLDVTNESQYTDVFSKAVAHLEFVNLVVNNVGIMDESKVDLTIAINFTACVKGTLIAENHMRRDKGGRGGRIINCCSVAGTYVARTFYHPVYNGTKHAVRAFTTTLSNAPDIKEQGIEYGVICPGPADTMLVRDLEAKTRFHKLHVAAMEPIMATVDQIVSGFLKLVTLDDMNGAILEVIKDHQMFVNVIRKELGDTYPNKSG